MIVGGLGALLVLGGAAFFFLKPAAVPSGPAPMQAPVPVATRPPVAPPPQATADVTTPPAEVPGGVAPAAQVPAAPAAAPPAAAPAGARPTATPLARPAATAAPVPAAARPGAVPPTAAAAPVVEAPAAANPAAQVPRLLEDAKAAIAARDLARAAQTLDQALRLQPGNAEATARKAEVESRIAALARKFVMGSTSVIGGKTVAKGPSGFDLGGGGVVQTEYSAQIRCATAPAAVEPGLPYTLRCSILNVGAKPFKLAAVSTTEQTDGGRSSGAGVIPARDIAPQSTADILERSGTWSAKSQWSIEILAKSNKDESFKASYSWR